MLAKASLVVLGILEIGCQAAVTHSPEVLVVVSQRTYICIGKFRTMPFLNIDNDVFVFSKFPPYLLEYKLILENPGMAGGHSYRFFKKNHDAAYLYADNLLNDPEKNSADFNGTTQGYLHLSRETRALYFVSC